MKFSLCNAVVVERHLQWRKQTETAYMVFIRKLPFWCMGSLASISPLANLKPNSWKKNDINRTLCINYLTLQSWFQTPLPQPCIVTDQSHSFLHKPHYFLPWEPDIFSAHYVPGCWFPYRPPCVLLPLKQKRGPICWKWCEHLKKYTRILGSKWRKRQGLLLQLSKMWIWIVFFLISRILLGFHGFPTKYINWRVHWRHTIWSRRIHISRVKIKKKKKLHWMQKKYTSKTMKHSMNHKVILIINLVNSYWIIFFNHTTG